MMAGTFVPAPGMWVPEQNGMNADCYWQPLAYVGAWNQPSTLSKCSNVHSEKVATVSTASTTASVSGDSTPPVRVQSAARAAKRQRGRERRKLFKAAARAAGGLEADTERARQNSGFEDRVDALAGEVKLVVKNTFFDVCISEDSSSDESEVALPATFFKTTSEIDGWRRDYRRFRLGHHQGAKGEVTEKDFSRDSLALL